MSTLGREKLERCRGHQLLVHRADGNGLTEHSRVISSHQQHGLLSYNKISFSFPQLSPRRRIPTVTLVPFPCPYSYPQLHHSSHRLYFTTCTAYSTEKMTAGCLVLSVPTCDEVIHRPTIFPFSTSAFCPGTNPVWTSLLHIIFSLGKLARVHFLFPALAFSQPRHTYRLLALSKWNQTKLWDLTSSWFNCSHKDSLAY